MISQTIDNTQYTYCLNLQIGLCKAFSNISLVNLKFQLFDSVLDFCCYIYFSLDYHKRKKNSLKRSFFFFFNNRKKSTISTTGQEDRCAWHAQLLSRIRLFVTLWPVALQLPLSMRFFQARILEWIAISSSRGSSRPRD